jgi:endonuclease YncB( thermonuclease family)
MRSLILLLICSNLFAGEVIFTAVSRVIDGDTIEILKDDEFVKVRLHGIDAPERSQKYGKEATDKVIELLHPVNMVTVNILDKDRYGRFIATVHTNDEDMTRVDSYGGVRGDVGLILVDQGLAWHYKKYSESEELEAAENYARSKKLGLWSEENPIPPWEYRKKN